MRTTKSQISGRIRAVWSAPLLFADYTVYYLYLLNPNVKTLASVCTEQTGLSLTYTWSQIPKDRVSREGTHLS